MKKIILTLVPLALLIFFFLQRDHRANVTWYKAPGITVAVNPRRHIPDGTYLRMENEDVVPHKILFVKVSGHMSPRAVADFDLSPEAFVQLAPLSVGRLHKVKWSVVK
jgi:hypothetical protein